MTKKNMNYTISCFDPERFQEMKSVGYKGHDLRTEPENEILTGHLFFFADAALLSTQITEVLRDIGILFYEWKGHVVAFRYMCIDHCFYNYSPQEYTHDGNPFQIKTFRFPSHDEDQQPHVEKDYSLMLYGDRFIHVAGLERDVFFFKKKDTSCHVCQKDGTVLCISDLIRICYPCIMTMMFSLKDD